jgi:hypothetical protein
MRKLLASVLIISIAAIAGLTVLPVRCIGFTPQAPGEVESLCPPEVTTAAAANARPDAYWY